MNLTSQHADPNSNLLFVNFNQDYTSLAVGTKNGYRLFSLSAVDKLEQIYENVDSSDICIVERLFSSSLVAIVSLSAPRKLKVCHFKKGTEICNYSYSNTILAVRLNRKRLIVALEESLYIHNIRDMKVLHTIRDTPPNPEGLCALSVNGDNCYLAYPGSNQIEHAPPAYPEHWQAQCAVPKLSTAQVGEVQIFDTENLHAVTMIPAHDSPLAALAFDPSGSKIATASEKGTVIRVYIIPEGTKLFEFRRGVKRCVSIGCLTFSADSLFLCASSNTETVHIFKLETPKESSSSSSSRPTEEPSGWMGYLGKALMTPASYLPTQVTDVLSQGRAFAQVKLPFSGLKNVCALATLPKPRVLIAAADGYLYMYNLDPSDGGDCTLLKQHRLDGQQDPNMPISQSEGTSETEGAEGGYPPSRPHSESPTPTFADVTQKSASTNEEGTGALKKGSSHPSAEDLLSQAVDYQHDPPATGLNTLRLDDDNEFPPMIHHTDPS